MNKVPGAIMLIILASVLLLAGCLPGSEPVEPRAEDAAPDFQLQNLDGQDVSLSDFRGKPVLLNFWATWCGPCRGEMPYLEQIYQEWSNNGLILLTINIGESSSQIGDFMREYNLSMPVLLDIRKTIAEEYNITAIPTTFFIDKDGIIQEKIIGAFPDKESIERHLSKVVP